MGPYTNCWRKYQTRLLPFVACENAISEAKTEMKQAEMRLKSAQSELKEKEKTSKGNEQAYSKDKALYEAMQVEMGKIEVRLIACVATYNLIVKGR